MNFTIEYTINGSPEPVLGEHTAILSYNVTGKRLSSTLLVNPINVDVDTALLAMGEIGAITTAVISYFENDAPTYTVEVEIANIISSNVRLDVNSEHKWVFLEFSITEFVVT